MLVLRWLLYAVLRRAPPLMACACGCYFSRVRRDAIRGSFKCSLCRTVGGPSYTP